MLSIILNHWSVYLYVVDIIVLSVLFFADWARRSSQERNGQAMRARLATERVVASEHTAKFRRAGNNVFPAEYRYGR